MDNSKINRAAGILYNSRINLKRIKELPKDCTPKSIQEAYAIQDELTKRYLSENEKTGTKLELFSKTFRICE